MNREIKFRAWNKYDGMTMPYMYLNETNGVCQAHISKPDAVMQYTGLKDKNGVEIYEGDIVTYSDFISEIVFMYGCFMVRHKSRYHHDGYDGEELHCWIDIGVTVIGNIYENPELLEKL